MTPGAGDEVERFFPGFRYEPGEDHLAVFVLRDMVPAGLLVGEPREPGTLRLALDFVILQYRDFKVGEAVFTGCREFFTARGIREVVTPPGNREHSAYLRRMGFSPWTRAIRTASTACGWGREIADAWRGAGQGSSRCGLDVTPHPVRELGFADLAGGESEHHRHHLRFRRLQAQAVELQENGHGDEADPLVPIGVAVAAGEPRPIRRGQRRQIPLPGVLPGIPGPRQRQRRFDGAFVPYAEKTAEALELLEVKGIDPGAPEPERLAHLASSRRAFWYRLEIRSSASITRRNSGS